MKQRILVCLTLVVVLVLGLCSAAFADEDPVKLYMALSNDRFSGPAEVTVTIRVTNSGDKALPGPVYLYDPAGNPVSDFSAPALEGGASVSWTGTWTVTEEQLALGRLMYLVEYPIQDDLGNTVTRKLNFYRPIVDAGAVAEVSVNRTITPTMARNGQEVSIIYEIVNTGTIDVTDVVIKESSTISKTNGRIAEIKAGEKAIYTFTVTMGKKNLTSNAQISYTAAGKTYTDSKPDATIKYGDVKLQATLKADKKGGNPGETVKFTLTLKNTGKSAYENVTVTDALLGTIFTGETVEAGKTLTLEKEITIAQSAEYQFTVSGQDSSGSTIETATGRVAVTAVDPAKEIALTVEAVADKTTIYVVPGIVKFTVNVTNTSEVEATDVTVTASGVTLYEFASIKPGQTRSFVRDVRVEVPGQFRFDAAVKNQLGQAVTFQSNIVQISQSTPTPTPSQVPILMPAQPEYEDYPTVEPFTPAEDLQLKVLGVVYPVSLALGCVFAALVAVGVIGRVLRKVKSGKAADHLELDGYRDYTQAVPAKHRHVMPESEAAEEPVQDVVRPVGEDEAPADLPPVQEEAPAAQPAEQPAEEISSAMETLYPRASRTEEAADAENAPRRRRRSSDEE